MASAAAPISQRRLQSPLTDLHSSIRRNSSKSCCANFMVRVLTSLLLVISISYFPSVAPGIVTKSFLWNSWENFYSVITGIVVSYVLCGQRRAEKSVEWTMGSDRLYMAKVLDFSYIWDFGFDISLTDSEMGGWNSVMPNLVDEWLGLPVRRLSSAFTEKRGVNCGNGGRCCGSRGSFGTGFRWSEERLRPFGDLSPSNLLEKFNEAVAFSSLQICLRGEAGKGIFGSRNLKKKLNSAQSKSDGFPLSSFVSMEELLKSNKEEDIPFSSKSGVNSPLTESEFLGKAPFDPQKAQHGNVTFVSHWDDGDDRDEVSLDFEEIRDTMTDAEIRDFVTDDRDEVSLDFEEIRDTMTDAENEKDEVDIKASQFIGHSQVQGANDASEISILRRKVIRLVGIS